MANGWCATANLVWPTPLSLPPSSSAFSSRLHLKSSSFLGRTIPLSLKTKSVKVTFKHGCKWRVSCWFKFGNRGVDAEGAGIYGSQARDDFDRDDVEQVRTIMVTRWNGFNTPLHMLAHALMPRFYDEELIAQSNGKRKAPHKDKEVASGVKKAFQRLFPASLQTKLRNEFASFAAGFEDFRDISAMEERTTMNSIKWWTCHGSAGVHLQDVATRVLSQVASSSAAERNWSTYGFIHNVKRNRLGSQKAEDLVYVHSNLCLVSRRGEEYTSGPHKDWDVDPENPDLELSLAALDIGGSGVGSTGASSSNVRSTSVEQASCSIFEDEDENE